MCVVCRPTANLKGLERRRGMRTKGCSWLTGLVSAVLLTFVVGSPAFGNGHDHCTVAALDDLYVFTATGFSVPTPPGPALPKAIIELIRFNGDGTLTVPGVTVSLNGVIPPVPPGGTGTYTVTDVPGDEACAGTIVFASGTSFNTVFAHSAKTIYMIQTNPTNVFQGTATKLSR
jgi:hypothetical protein